MKTRTLIHRCLAGEATEAEVQELDRLLAENPTLRREWVAEASNETGLRQIAMERVASNSGDTSQVIIQTRKPVTVWRFPAMAAAIAFLLGLAIMHFGGKNSNATQPIATIEEASAQGFAVVANLFDAEWMDEKIDRRLGDSLGAEALQLQSGVAKIQFFSGATMVIQGPAEIELQSAWEATCWSGVVRMQVPPAARGFVLHGPDTEIIDLGTEFGFEVRDGKAHVEVLDGEISIQHRDEKNRIAEKGEAWQLPGDAAATEVGSGLVAFPEVSNFSAQAESQQQLDFARWQSHRDAFARDPRVIAYYTFESDRSAALIPSASVPRDAEFDGAIVLAETAAGRWPEYKKALEFHRPGSRVRVRIPGEFQALTFAAWVRVDSLDRRYNALFMGDGYETGEPHWQIRDDGKMMLSVMVDDSRPHPKFPDVRFHHVYFSPPMWELSMSGQWLHLASVFDPAGRAVSHYVNGERLSREKIDPEFGIESLRIGNGEIGNWGQPFRKTPSFAIRNLNGRIDELGIMNAALTDSEIKNLYENSRAGSKRE
ncbi:MAG: hypothetical protein ACI9R3_005715 [Verrucomicrobiales bacterium]|jgi:hypothetical protein